MNLIDAEHMKASLPPQSHIVDANPSHLSEREIAARQSLVLMPIPAETCSRELYLRRVEACIRKLRKIDQKIHEIANERGKIVLLSFEYLHQKMIPAWSAFNLLSTKMIFQIFSNDAANLCLNHPQACGVVANAIMRLNVFNQKYIKSIQSYEALEEELKNNHKGTFNIQIGDCNFSNSDGEYEVFPGHAFTIIKGVKGASPYYRLVQSYIYEYDVASFLSRGGWYFFDFPSLQAQILSPLHSLLNHVGPWGEAEIANYEKITSISPRELIGLLPSRPLSEMVEFECTTDEKHMPRFQSSEILTHVASLFIATVVAARIMCTVMRIFASIN